MKMFKNTATALVAALTLGLSANAMAHKVAIVDMQAIYKNLPQMGQIEQKLATEFGERRQALEKLQGDIRFEMEHYQRESATMSAAQKTALEEKIKGMQKELATQGRPLEQAIKARQNEELQKLQGIITDAIQAEAKAGKFDEVKVKDVTLYFNPDKVVDLSTKIVERVSKSN